MCLTGMETKVLLNVSKWQKMHQMPSESKEVDVGISKWTLNGEYRGRK